MFFCDQQVNVKHKNLETGTVFMWDRNKFIDRKFMMQEMYQNYVEGDKNWNDGAGTVSFLTLYGSNCLNDSAKMAKLFHKPLC